jgi:hypothetical protein
MNVVGPGLAAFLSYDGGGAGNRRLPATRPPDPAAARTVRRLLVPFAALISAYASPAHVFSARLMPKGVLPQPEDILMIDPHGCLSKRISFVPTGPRDSFSFH